jgi:hypothetical protein
MKFLKIGYLKIESFYQIATKSQDCLIASQNIVSNPITHKMSKNYDDIFSRINLNAAKIPKN